MLDTVTTAEAFDYRKSPFIRVARMDDWCSFADAPTSQPFMMSPRGFVCRPMSSFEDAKEYAELAFAFFAQNNVAANVFVIHGPTSTTKRPFEVVTETAGYRVAFKAQGTLQPEGELPAARELVFGASTVIRANEAAHHRFAGPVTVRFDRNQGWHYTKPGSGEIGRDMAFLEPIRRSEAPAAPPPSLARQPARHPGR